MQGANSEVASRAAEFYDARWQQQGAELTRQRRLRISFILESIARFKNSRAATILDLGCGCGWMAPFLSPYGKVTGIDFAPNSITFAEQTYGSHGKFVLAQPNQTITKQLGISSFDIVVSSEVIEHTVDQSAFLGEINSLLRPEGICILTTPNGNVWEEFERKFKADCQPIENWLTPDQCSRTVSEAGFEILRHVGGVFPGLRLGRRRWMQHRLVTAAFRTVGLSGLHGHICRSNALYQFLVAKKLPPTV